MNTPADPWVLPAGTVNVPVAFTWSGTDVAADMAAPLYANVDFGDGTVVSNDNGSVSHSYSAPGVYAIALTLHDKDGGTAARNTAVTIRNTTFSITPPPAAINEGDPFLHDCSVILSTPAQSSVTVTLANSDPSKLRIIGSGMVSFAAGESVKTFQVEALDGPATVTIGGAASHTYSLDSPALISTLNVAPVLNNPPDPWVLPPGTEGGFPVNFAWAGADVPADMAAPLYVVVDFGDGTSSGQINGNSGSTSHIYNTPNTYGVTITLHDKDGGTAARSTLLEIMPAFQVQVTEIVHGLAPPYKGLPGLGAGMIDDTEPLSVRMLMPPGNRPNIWLYKYSPLAATTIFMATPTNLVIDVDGTPVAYDSFFHVWQGEGFISPLATIPIANPSAMLQLSERNDEAQGGRDISGVFSREYFPEDNYADIDQDQLPDLWEDLHWPGTLAFETPNRMGNPDNDFLPRGANPNMAYPAAGNNYAPDGTAFGNVFEVRGLDPALNALGSELPPPPPDDWPLDEPRYENDTREFYGTDPTVDDTDNDGLTDGWEYYFWMNATNRGIVGESYDPQAIITGNPIDSATIAADFHPLIAGDAGTDTDGDGLSNLEEMVIGTNPVHWDTDGDYMCDGWEVMRGLDPITRDGGGNPDGDYMAALGWRPTTPRTGDPVAP
ncbi:MAG: PKD domain-containing protein, partial [Lentisphaerae bacterium]|nr:PKD domain-containing protein [Lentisphaerota bacterium]